MYAHNRAIYLGSLVESVGVSFVPSKGLKVYGHNSDGTLHARIPNSIQHEVRKLITFVVVIFVTHSINTVQLQWI